MSSIRTGFCKALRVLTSVLTHLQALTFTCVVFLVLLSHVMTVRMVRAVMQWRRETDISLNQ
jgi:hypothetical protein